MRRTNVAYLPVDSSVCASNGPLLCRLLTEVYVHRWSHMDALLSDKSCVASYLLEYGLYRFDRNKRETLSSSAFVSPAINPDTTSYSIVLDDDCKIYSVHIAVIPTVPTSGAHFIIS